MPPLVWSSAPIVQFSVPTVDLGASSYVQVEWNSTSATVRQRDFSLETPFFPTYGEIYGGLKTELKLHSDPNNGTYTRLHVDPNAWPNTQRIFIQTNGASQGTFMDVTLVQVWQKSHFLHFAGEPVFFEPQSTLSVNITAWFGNAIGGQGMAPQIRFLVRDGSDFYVSETFAAFSNTGGLLQLTDFVDNPAEGKRWAPISLSADSFSIPSGMSFASRSFSDVTAVGFIAEGSREYANSFSYDAFSATAVPEPAFWGFSLGALVLGGAMLRRGRWRRPPEVG